MRDLALTFITVVAGVVVGEMIVYWYWSVWRERKKGGGRGG